MLNTLDSSSVSVTLAQRIQEAIVEARAACELNGTQSSDCAVAWDIVEELQAERCHRQQAQLQKTSLERYCDQYPDADECRIYDN